jgi:hypothetical protein
MAINKMKHRTPVVSSDDRRIGFADRPDEKDKMLRVTCMKAGCGDDHQIPHDWVTELGECVYLNKTKAYVAANWRPWPASTSPDRRKGDRGRATRGSPSLA